MNDIILELDLNNKDDLDFLNNLKSNLEVEIFKSEKLSGVDITELIIAGIGLTAASIELISNFYSLKKLKGTKSIKVKNKRIVLENLSAKEIKIILEKYIN